jgi:hypothetical protein
MSGDVKRANLGIPNLTPTGPSWLIGTMRSSHDLPDHAVIFDLRAMLTANIEGETWFAVVPFTDGRVVCRGSGLGVPTPPEEVFDLMLQLALDLNEEHHAGGHWVVAWSDETQEISGFWRDEDSDLHVIIQWPLADMRREGITKDDMLAGAVAAWREQRIRTARLELREDQIVKATLARRQGASH